MIAVTKGLVKHFYRLFSIVPTNKKIAEFDGETADAVSFFLSLKALATTKIPAGISDRKCLPVFFIVHSSEDSR